MNTHDLSPKRIGESDLEAGVAVLGAVEPLGTVEEQHAERLERREAAKAKLAHSVLGKEVPEPIDIPEIEIQEAGTVPIDLKPGDIGYNAYLDGDATQSYHIPGSGGPGSAGGR